MCAFAGSSRLCWPRSPRVLLAVLFLSFISLSVPCAELPLPTPPEVQSSPPPGQPWSPEWQTFLDDSTLLVNRLRERLSQSESLQDSLLLAGGRLDFSAELSLKLGRLLEGASPLLESLQTDLLGISSSLSGLRTDFTGLSQHLIEYTALMRGQVRELRGERDAARLKASAWRVAALVGGGIGLASLAALVVIIAWKK